MHDNFTDTSDLSEWGFWHVVLLRKNMSRIEVQAIWFSAALRKYGGFSEHSLILYCKNRFDEAVFYLGNNFNWEIICIHVFFAYVKELLCAQYVHRLERAVIFQALPTKSIKIQVKKEQYNKSDQYAT